ncbi:MAG TPA: hypothetical protein DHW64_12150 [Chitinophagaceae bacterium]|jgi:hypothetical protein|nr:hypothetical protein [Chitinophagaceae bacterium]
MNTTEKVTLINGVFTPDEAKEVLLTLLNHKINFHRMRNFSSEERFGKPDPVSAKRLPALYESREQVLSILNDATTSGYKLEIESLVSIRKGEKIEAPVQEEVSSVSMPSADQEIVQLW